MTTEPPGDLPRSNDACLSPCCVRKQLVREDGKADDFRLQEARLAPRFRGTTTKRSLCAVGQRTFLLTRGCEIVKTTRHFYFPLGGTRYSLLYGMLTQ